MSRRKRLLRRTAIACSIPVVAGAAWVLTGTLRGDEQYVAGTETEGITRRLDRAPGVGDSPFRFTDVTEAAGIRFRHFPFVRTHQLPEDMGPGAAWGDFDGDGLADLFLVDFHRKPERRDVRAHEAARLRQRLEDRAMVAERHEIVGHSQRRESGTDQRDALAVLFVGSLRQEMLHLTA